MAESEQELKSLLMRVKEDSEKAGLKLNHQKNKIWSLHFMTNRRGKSGSSNKTLFSWAPKSLWLVTANMQLKDSCSLEGKLLKRQHIKKRRHHFADQGPYTQSYGFSSSHIWM